MTPKNAHISRRRFLLIPPHSDNKNQQTEEHPVIHKPEILGVAGGLSWEVLTSDPLDGERFTTFQNQWNNQQALIGGHFVPLDAYTLSSAHYLISPSAAHCMACMNTPNRARVLISFDHAIEQPQVPMGVTGILTTMHQPDSPIFYHMRVIDMAPL